MSLISALFDLIIQAPLEKVKHRYNLYLIFFSLANIISIVFQWRFMDSAGYLACQRNVTDSYLTMPFMKTDPANSLAVDIRYSLKDCTMFPGKCLFSIGIYALRTHGKLTNFVSPFTKNFSLIGNIGNSTLLDATEYSHFTNETTIAMQGKSGIYLAFRNSGFCGTIRSVSLYYTHCPTRHELVEFPSTQAPNSSVNMVKVSGTCVLNAVPITSATMLSCFSNGTFTVTSGCMCIEGFEKYGNVCRG